MSRELFGRYLNVYTIGTFQVILSELHCKIVIQGAETGKPNICDINIYNITESTSANINPGDRLFIDAGYGDKHSIIFQGEVKFKRYGKIDGVNTYLNLQCNNIKTQDKLIAKTYSKGQTKQLVTTQAGLTAGLLSMDGNLLMPQDSYLRAKTIVDTPHNYLKKVSLSEGMFFVFDNERYNVFDINNLLAVKTTILNKDTGLIGRPKITQQGIEGRCLILPTIEVGSMVQIMPASIDEFKVDMSFSGMGKSIGGTEYDPKGLYWIIKTTYVLDNRGPEWYIDFQAVNSRSVRAPFSKTQKAISIGGL